MLFIAVRIDDMVGSWKLPVFGVDFLFFFPFFSTIDHCRRRENSGMAGKSSRCNGRSAWPGWMSVAFPVLPS